MIILHLIFMWIHVEKEKATAKFDLENAKLIRSKRFNAGELKEIRKLVIENSELFKIKWDENIAGN